MDVYQEIRRFQLEGVISKREAARRLGISRNTVKKYWEGDAVPWEKKTYEREPILSMEVTSMRKIPCFLVDIIAILICCCSINYAASWTCSTCGHTNEGNFCPARGSKRPDIWLCQNCNTINSLNYCEKCGTEKGSLIVDNVYRMDGSSMNDTKAARIGVR